MQSVSIRVVLAMALCVAVSPAGSAQEMEFENVTSASGFPFPNWPSPGGGQVTWGDYDGDGYEDILIGCRYLWRNSGPPDYTFTQTLTLNGGNGGIWADIDNDGDLDIFCTSSTNSLWINNGDGTFTDGTDSAGLRNRGCQDYDGDCFCTSSDSWCPWTHWPFTAAAWGDFDADGHVDLYVGNYETWDGGTLYCWPDFLYRNDGDGTFTDVSWSSGIRDADGDGTHDEQPNEEDRRCVRGVTWGDYNNDNLPDVYVSNYRIMPNTLWENQGDGSFVNVADARGCATAPDGGDEGHTLGSDWGDMDNDGDLDLYTADLAHRVYWQLLGHDASALYRNNGGASDYDFTDIRVSTGMEQMSASRNDWTETSPAWADADNDGDLDIFVSQIYMYSNYYSKLYRNDGTASEITTFTDMTDYHGDCPADPREVPTAGSACMKSWYDYSAAWADYDNDGDLDLAVNANDYWVACEDSDSDGVGECQYHDMPEPDKPECQTGDPNTWCQPHYFHLYRNVTSNGNHWLEVRLQATTPENNRAGIGARVTAVVGGSSMIREVSGGTGYHSTQCSLRAHFGLGSSTVVNQLRVLWPNGTEIILDDIGADQILELTDELCTDEVCDGRDNDCDDLVDEGFADEDEDGHAYCVDCNESDPTIHPGAADPCDGVDRDCDGVDGTGNDDDHDGYSTVCAPIDCVDSDPEINPGHAEMPYNEVDDDCSPATPDDDLDADGHYVVVANIPTFDDLASGETDVAHEARTGSYLDTQVSDDTYESVTEQIIGNGNKKQSLLEHRWTIPVSVGQGHLFHVEAHHTPNGESDDFVFAYSTDGVSYTDMLTVTKMSDDNTPQAYELPGSLEGDITIRVLDTDRTQSGSPIADTVYVDRLWIQTTPRSDCDDGDPEVYPGAPERCNGVDDDCEGTPDDNAGPPSATEGFGFTDTSNLAWDPMPGASAYDVVKGDLALLLGSGGGFTESLLLCVDDATSSTSTTDADAPDVGGGLYYLVRTIGCGQNGTYDSPGTSQQGSRDAEVAASPNACP